MRVGRNTPAFVHRCAAAALAALIAACGGGGAVSSDSAAQHSPRINYDEEEFAADPELHANPDDIVTLRLEHPDGGYDASLDTGDEPGVDVIPYRYLETMEREYCWETDPGAEPPPDGASAYMRLVDAGGREVLRVEQDGECVRQTIAAGRYRAEFHHGASANSDRDLIFVLPRESADARDTGDHEAADASTTATVLAEDPHAREPFCPFANAREEQLFLFMVLRPVNSNYDQPCPRPAKSWGHIPIQPFFMKGVCSDVTLIHERCTYIGQRFIAGTLAGTQLRVYDDLDFRGGRKTLVADVDVRSTQILGNLFVFDAPASLVPVFGTPAANADFLIRTNGCDHCNLTGVSLADRDFERAWLRLADLSHASLEGARLNAIWGDDTIFKSAHLADTELERAYLGNAHFDSAGTIDGGDGRRYPAANLSRAKLGGAVLVGTDLRGATLDHADFTEAHFDGADLSAASAVGASFERAMFTSTVSLRQGTLSNANFTDAIMDGVALTDASGGDVILTRAKLSGANLQGAVLPRARMEGAVLAKAVLGRDPEHAVSACQLSKAYMANVDLSSAEATGVNLRQARFYGLTATAVNAVLTNADLVGAELSGTNFSGATLQNATLDGATCVNCRFTNAHMAATSTATNDGAKFNGARLEGADFTAAAVGGCVFTDAIVSFDAGVYSVGDVGEVHYATVYGASQMAAVTTLASVICPDGLRGPCNTQERLSPHGGTPTHFPTRTPPATWTPGGVDPFATPTPRAGS